ncbi:MAG: 2-amino-4-hydroxy-6-hydroxymethyldihydropteridine diphosphokinase [Actinomycetota bacterium]
MASTRAYVGLGSNLGDRLDNLKRAVELLLEKGLAVMEASSVYETDPVGPPQPDFLNAAVAIDCGLPPAELVAVLKQVEAEIGREQSERWGPRVIDLDLLLYGEETVAQPGLNVPHAELTNRAFALVPVLEIDNDVELPSGEPLSAFCEKDPEGIQVYAPPGSLLGG